jgi:hypothetical protein
MICFVGTGVDRLTGRFSARKLAAAGGGTRKGDAGPSFRVGVSGIATGGAVARLKGRFAASRHILVALFCPMVMLFIIRSSR